MLNANEIKDSMMLKQSVEREERAKGCLSGYGRTTGPTMCVGCNRPKLGSSLYYVGGQNEDEPLCGACMCDELLSLRVKMQNKGIDSP